MAQAQAPAILNAAQIDARQEAEDKNSFYRRGIPWFKNIRRHMYSQYPVPRLPGGTAAWPGTVYGDFRQPDYTDAPAVAEARNAATATGMPGEQMSSFPIMHPFAGGQPNPPRLRFSARKQTKQMARRLFGNWVHNRILGWGGNGVAALFKHRTNGTCVVAKCEIAAPGLVPMGYQIDAEINVLKALQGSMHILPIEGTGRRPRLVMTPFYKRGALGTAIVKAHSVRRRNEAISDDFLWHFGECLARMVVGMRYPALHWSDTRSWNQWHIGQPVLERVPTANRIVQNHPRYGHRSARLARLAGDNPRHFYDDCWDWVHFDIDPTNIFVDVNDAHHPVTPKLVLADFGSTESGYELRHDISGDNSWEHRRIAKTGWFTPEQFTSEWAFVRREPTHENSQIAGHYSEKSNIWQIGMVLHCLMSLTRPPERPTPRWLRAPSGTRHCTYGAYIHQDNAHLPDTRRLRFRHTDQNLRELVARCLRDDPAQRPRLRTLLQTFQQRAAQPPTLRPRQLKNERDAYFVDPRTVSVAGSSAQRLRQWLLGQINYVQMMNP